MDNDRNEVPEALPPAIDVDLGVSGDPVSPVQRAFERRGVHLSVETIKRLRTAYRLAGVDKLRANDASLKNQFCLRVIQHGLAYRRPSPTPPRTYAAVGLAQAMQAALGCTHLDMSLIMRVMRSDLAVWSTHMWLTQTSDHELVSYFQSVAGTFLRTHRRYGWRLRRGMTDRINAAWDKETIHGFYVALCSLGSHWMRGTWLPYELDVLLRFYTRQRELGDPLTPLDQQVLAWVVSGEPRVDLLSRLVCALVGVDYQSSCVTMHRALLTTGSHEPLQTPRAGRRPTRTTADQQAEYPLPAPDTRWDLGK